jgi:hypothetical protein
MSAACTQCAAVSAAAGSTPVLCGPGRTLIYGVDEIECARFETDAADFDATIASWTTVAIANSSGVTGTASVDAYPGCRDALEVFYCAQQPVLQEAPSTAVSTCSDYRRPYSSVGRCLSFCPAIRDVCPAAAAAHCETFCRDAAFESFCPVLEVSGLDSRRWDDDTLDIMNLYRLEAEQGSPLLRDGRPFYRSIPARRPAGSARATKLQYYLYATHTRGYTEWLIDTNDLDSDGARAFVADATLAPCAAAASAR